MDTEPRTETYPTAMDAKFAREDKGRPADWIIRAVGPRGRYYQLEHLPRCAPKRQAGRVTLEQVVAVAGAALLLLGIFFARPADAGEWFDEEPTLYGELRSSMFWKGPSPLCRESARTTGAYGVRQPVYRWRRAVIVAHYAHESCLNAKDHGWQDTGGIRIEWRPDWGW